MVHWIFGYVFSIVIFIRSGRSEDCFDRSVGLRDTDGIPSYYLQARSYSSKGFGNRKYLNKGDKVWCTSSVNKTEGYLEVDLGSKYRLCGVSTNVSNAGHVTKFILWMSSDRIKWAIYRENNKVKIFLGGVDTSDLMKHNFTTTARFVRFYPIDDVKDACMLVELYGTEFTKEICHNSSLYNQDFKTSTSEFIKLNNGQVFCIPDNHSNPYLQIDIGSYSVVCAVKALGNQSSSSMGVKTYQLKYSMDENNWASYQERNLVKKFVTSKDHILLDRILCRYIRFTAFRNIKCISVEIYGYLNEALLIEDIGLKYNGQFKKKQSFYSSSSLSKRKPENARLYMPDSWCSDSLPTSTIEIDLAQKYYIFAISVQGYWKTYATLIFTTRFMLTYSLNYQNWNNTITDGDQWVKTNNTNVVSVYHLRNPIEARIIRLEMQIGFPYSCMKVELHGTSAVISEWCPNQYPLGLRAGIIPNNNMTASTANYYQASDARLHNSKAWYGGEHDNAFINIDFGELVLISGVATQGFDQGEHSGRVTRYKISYSYENAIWFNYTYQNNSDKIFNGNISPDYDAIFANWFDPPIVTRLIRLIVLKKFEKIRLRMELYGCREEFEAPAVKIESTKPTLNRTVNAVVNLTCIAHGQPNISITWTRDGQEIHNSSFEVSNTTYPSHVGISGRTVSNLMITYNQDQAIFENFNCTKSEVNPRELYCFSIYECSAFYPGGKAAKKTVIVNVTPNLILPDTPGRPMVYNIKSQSANVSWKIPSDHIQSRITEYVIHLLNESGSTIKKYHTAPADSGLINGILSTTFSNLSQYTTYGVKIAAVNAIEMSNFTKIVDFFTLLRATVSLNQRNILKVEEKEENISVTCTGRSYPTPNVTWKKNGTELTIIKTNETANRNTTYQLILKSEKDNKTSTTIEVKSILFLSPAGIKYEDYGNYSCEVLNANESDIPVKETIQVVFSPTIVEKPKSQQVLENDNITLTCEATGPPRPYITWYINKEGVEVSIMDLNNGILVLKNVKSVGRYKFTVICIAVSNGGNTTAEAIITILVKPRITNLTKSFTALLYSNISLKCNILANPSPEIWWTKNGSDSHEQNIRFKNENKTLVIINAQLNNIGTYSCLARNNLSNISQSLKLRLKALPEVYILGKLTRKLKRGQKNVNITCLGNGYPNPKAIWKVNGSNIDEVVNTSNKDVYQKSITNVAYFENVSSILYFNQTGAKFKNFGNYTCEVSIDSAPDTDNKTVEVLFYPIVEIGPNNTTVLEGKEVIFDCKVDGRPAPSTSWLFQNTSNITANRKLFQNGSLQLFSVQNNKIFEGIYSCFAKNKVGESKRSSATLTVHVPAKILAISRTEIHQLNHDVPLNCNASGDPFPLVSWTKFNDSISLTDKQNFVFTNNNQTLTIRNVSLKEQGTYICSVKNEYNVEKKNVTVNVEVSPTATVNQSLVLLKSVNETAVVECTGNGFPSPIVRWFRDGLLINTKNSSLDVYQTIVNEIPTKFLGDVVSILYVIPDDTYKQFGNYTCNATKTKDNEHKLAFVEIVLVPKVRITRHPNKDTVLEGTDVMFNCTADGSPEPLVKWSKLIKNSSDEVLGNATIGSNLLDLRNVTNKNEGIYICSANNRGDTVSTNVTLIVHVKPRILTELDDDDVENGTSYQLNCSADGDPNVKYSWYKDGNESIPNSNVINQNKTLKIDPVAIENEGLYKCIATNVEGDASTNASITVFGHPEILIPPKNQTLNKTQTAKFFCLGKGIPAPGIIWRKNGKVITTGIGYNITYKGNIEDKESTLLIRNLEYSDRGKYSCAMNNRKSFQNKTAVLTVQVPSRSNAIQPIRRLKIGTSVNLTCEIYGFPLPNVSWKKNGTNINESHYRVILVKTKDELKWNSNLEIKILQRSDNGSYSCFLENPAGTDQTNLSLVVLERPDQLTFSSRNLTSRTIVLEWMVTFDGNSKIKNFFLNYSSNTTTDELMQNKNVTFNDTTLMVQNLKPWTLYTFQITAVNDIGSSKPSVITRRTSEDLPSRPENVNVFALNAKTLIVMWSSPKEENGIIRKYTVYYKVNSQTNEFNISTHLLKQKIPDLKPYTNYTIQVQATTSIGPGNRSNMVFQQTNESTPSKPLNLRTNVENSTSITLRWWPPEHENGIIIRYTIYNQEVKPIKNTTHTEELITHLKPFTNYTFWVRASTSIGLGNISEMVSNKTAEATPSKPRNLHTMSSYINNMTVAWDKPNQPNGILLSYTIRLRTNVSKPDQPNGILLKYTIRLRTNVINGQIGVPLKNMNYTIEDLNAFTSYFVDIRANTSAGHGYWSDWIQVTTKPGDELEHIDRTTMIPFVLPRSQIPNISFYRIIVVFLKNNENINPKNITELLSYDAIMQLSPEKRYGKAYTAFAFKPNEFDKYERFVIGEEQTFSNKYPGRKRAAGDYKNGRLIPGTRYAYFLRVYVGSESNYTSSEPKVSFTEENEEVDEQKTKMSDDVLIVIVVAAVFVLILVTTAIWIRVKKRKNTTPNNPCRGLTNLGHPIPLHELRSYLESMDFTEKYESIPKVTYAISEGSKPTNMPKNRYRNILPFDYARVSLSMKEGKEDSDYINASFIKGLEKPEKYIATQGPLPTTTDDFWKMVWEQECSVIVMLTGLEENGKVKCYQYWPATPEEKVYDNITVSQTGQAVLADYTVRYVDVKNLSTGEIRKVEHLHFTAWPDHGVPRYPGPLIHFYNRFRSALVGSQPVIVHCSAGCGRTGTFIALDYVLQKIGKEQDCDTMVDILRYVREMRGQRSSMVQTQEQYEFIHHAVLEAVTFARTEISTNDIRVKAAMLQETIPGTRKTRARGEFEKLQQVITVEPCEDGSSPENKKKNRSQVIPYDYNRVCLVEMENKTDYINASLISGYQYARNFIATQNPLTNTVEDFWRMVHEQRCGVVVCITTKKEQDDVGLYWPNEGFSCYGPITVTIEEVRNDFEASGFVVRKFNLTDTRDTKGDTHSVTHFHFHQWPHDDLPHAPSLLQLLAQVECAQRISGNKLIAVHCSDGCGRTGTLCAIVMTIERVKLENTLDLVMTVRNLRAQRPDMIENEMQYKFCYDAVVAFLASFDDQLYENFARKTSDGEDFPTTSVNHENQMITKC